jgi:LacI family transcriptional regulator
MPTLEEIAKLAGVSRSTVSRVVNNDSLVKDATRERVLEIIQQVNFQPSTVARRLAGGRSGIFGLVIPSGVAQLFTDPYFPELLQSVSATCNATGNNIMLWLTERGHEQQMINRIINNGLLDGVIISSMDINDPITAAIYQSHIPFVIIGPQPEGTDCDSVDVENVSASQNMVSSLIERGHHRIGTITGPKTKMESQHRLQGYQQALNSARIKIESALIEVGNFTENGGYRAAKKLISQDITAIFTASDLMARGAYRALNEMGLNIPGDMAIASFDDAPFAVDLAPPLTTVKQSSAQLGSIGVELLIDRIEKPDAPPKHIVLPTEIQWRASV